MSGPIKPSEVAGAKTDSIPDAVFDVFNELIVREMGSYCATVDQNEVVRLIATRIGCTQRAVYDNRWLDVEDSYRAAGWKVEYDRPGYNETYKPTFTFTRPRKGSGG